MKRRTVIEMKNVSKSFVKNQAKTIKQKLSFNNKKSIKSKKVIKNLDLKIFQNEVVGFYGPNGSGKSTLLRIMAGIIKPDLGKIKIKGSVASVIELGTGLKTDLTGRENIFLYGSIFGLSSKQIKQNISKIIDFSGLDEEIDDPIRTYSSGMKTRLAFSIVIYSDSDIVLLDEVFSVGDQSFKDKSFRLLNEMKGKKTIIISSHNWDLLFGFCDRVIKFENGEILKKNKYIDLFLSIPEGKEFVSTIISNSMYPYLKKGDKVKIKKEPYGSLGLGDVVAVYVSIIDEVIVHRLTKNSKDSSGKQVFFSQGDSSFSQDPWAITPKNYLGKVYKLDKDN